MTDPTRRTFLSALAYLPGLSTLSAWLARPAEAIATAKPDYLHQAARFWSASAVELGAVINRIAKVAKFELDCSDGLGCGPAHAMATMIEQGAFIRWIPVTERLPEMEIRSRGILICSRGDVFAGQFINYDTGPVFEDIYQRRFKIGNVTHWAELPSPPNTEPTT